MIQQREAAINGAGHLLIYPRVDSMPRNVNLFLRLSSMTESNTYFTFELVCTFKLLLVVRQQRVKKDGRLGQ